MYIMSDWFTHLENEDMNFIKRFVLSSGSLKAVAQQYGVTYPTVRLRLDRLIQKIEEADTVEMRDPFVMHIKQLALNEKISLEAAKSLINEYHKHKTRKE